MPVTSQRRFSTTGSTYLPSTLSGSYRSSLATSGSDYNNTNSTSTSSYRSSYRSSYSRNDTTPSTTTSKYSTSKYSRTSLDRDLPSSSSSYLRSESRTRDITSSTLNSTTSSSLRHLATTGSDLYEKYSPSSYIPRSELSRSRSLSETQKLIKDKTPTRDILNGTGSITGKARSSSIRNALPPTSSTANKLWERDRSSYSSRAVTDTDSYVKPRSSYTSSSSLLDSYDKSTTSSCGTVEGLCGLKNIGNTCFMNSVLQCLSHTNELTKYVKTQQSPKTSTKDQKIFAEYVKLIKEMWSANTKSVTPFDLKSAISSKYRMYSGSTQQDAQEFLRFFLDTLHCALNAGVKGEKLEIDDNLSDNKIADLTWEWYSRIEKSMIKDLFVGQFKSSLKCTVCGNTSVTFDPFWDLSLPLPSSSTTKCKLESCLELFIKEEVLDGDEMPTCSKCETRRKCTKSFKIQRFPKILVIHLKRFSETRWSKLTNIVEFPTGERELDMSPYASSTNSTDPTFTLYGISNHMGSTAGGHYVAVCKHPVTKKWHEFNDNQVTDTSESNLISSSAYLLFYERS